MSVVWALSLCEWCVHILCERSIGVVWVVCEFYLSVKVSVVLVLCGWCGSVL